MTKSRRFETLIFLLSLLLISPLSFAQEEADSAKEAKPPKLFEDSAEMRVTLSGPWNSIRRNIEDDTKYPVELTYTGADGQQHTFDAQVAPRGVTRRFKVCKFPPLKIHFDKKKMKGTEFRGNKSLKLVTYCSDNDKYEQYYIKEFLTYRIYNMFTELSFRVRPMIIDYVDSEKGGKPITRFSFLIEDVDDVAKRSDFEELGLASVKYRQLDPLTTTKLSLFQYMIGNLDWAATDGPKEDSCCHNSKLVGAGDDKNPKYGVPYDFDSSGLVNAHYASPPPQLKVRNIRQRLYRGFCAFDGHMPATIAEFNQKKPDILALFQNNEHLSKGMKKDAVRYIDGFYEIINDPKKLKKSITDNCRGKP